MLSCTAIALLSLPLIMMINAQWQTALVETYSAIADLVELV
ncbi:MAG: hypothetical protein ACRC11_01460 [Xenococcaceae cyanobacterium]